jgi:hypothetical protein
VFQNLKLKHFTYRNQKRFSTAEIAARVQIVQAVKTFQLFRETGKQHGGELASHEATASEKQFNASVPRREMRTR